MTLWYLGSFARTNCGRIGGYWWIFLKVECK